jgi:hypothetical protein
MRRFIAVTLLVTVVVGALYALVVRPYHLRWGALDAELVLALPGDRFIAPNTIVSTRAITIDAPPEAVWPWLVQMGQGRGGFYSFDWLENLFAANMQNAERIEPALQPLAVGDRFSLQEDGPYAEVSLVVPGQSLSLEGWSYHLQPLNDQQTRLIVRYPSFVVDSPGAAFYYYVIFEPAHFVMEAGMMLGIKLRAEAAS